MENTDNTDVTQDQPEKLSKKALAKLEKQAAKDKAKQERESQQTKKDDEVDPLAHLYGDIEIVQSAFRTERVWTPIKELTKEMAEAGEVVLIRARVHNVRAKGNIAFIVFRDQYSTVQGVASKCETVSKKMLKYMADLQNESIVDVTAKLTVPQEAIDGCSQKNIELQMQEIHAVSRSKALLPFQMTDACRKINKADLDIAEEAQTETDDQDETDGKKEIKVHMKTRLDNRILDLRTPGKQAIFSLKGGVCQLFREFLFNKGFTEIQTPKLIAGASEGGSNIFKFEYFGKLSCLAQSPQLYKQMCVQSDFKKVFEVGPVFRAENSFTHRHLCEFTGLDLEMDINESYHEIMDLMGHMFKHIFEGLETRFKPQLDAINEQFPFEPFKFKFPVPRLTFEEGVALLKENGVDQEIEDLSTEVERKLGALVRKKYDTDFYFLCRYPMNARPFYTMPCKDDPKFTNSYDFFMRGEEIVSGAQRIHCPRLLEKRATECGLDVNTIRSYIESMEFGAYPHGGVGIGLERVVMLYCDLRNIRNSSLFPRDPNRIKP